MRALFGWMMAGLLVAGQAGVSYGQVTISPGNPYTGVGPGLTIGQPAWNTPGYPTGYAAGMGYSTPGTAYNVYGQPVATSATTVTQPSYYQGYTGPQGYLAPAPNVTGTVTGQPNTATTTTTTYAAPMGSYYNSAYQGYTSTASPYYNQGYYGSNYVVPTRGYYGAPGYSGGYYSSPYYGGFRRGLFRRWW